MTRLHVWLALLMVCAMATKGRAESTNKFLLVVHGGAGVWRKELTPEKERAARDVMRHALLAGQSILKTNGVALDAVEAAIRVMEDSPLFNAGKGAVLTSEGTAELDASIMNGVTLQSGAVASVKRIRNPISAARLVMEQSPHVLMVGEGAETFAKSRDMKLVSPRYFITSERQQQLKRIQAEGKANTQRSAIEQEHDMIGTVGAVVLDQRGNLAAGTSTGGMANKKFGRVGDSPIIGAGTYANNKTCAVSATGHGEYFIRAVVAHDVSALMEYKNLPLRAATDEVIRKVGALGGKGGVIAIDREGNVAMPFNTEGMFRGELRSNGEIKIAVYPE
ncbi:MAG TPA: isoaspartyl peptidase/L-asparaginase [Candidatus Acidoferrum sp.]|nr:isoaspartyl peptidase/L-asparaginase [Candidatus Acidoferrum sp.]